jgi:hypothetical protein
VAGANNVTAVAKMRLTAEWSNLTEHKNKNIYPKTGCGLHKTNGF